jgi:hypothetical protein
MKDHQNVHPIDRHVEKNEESEANVDVDDDDDDPDHNEKSADAFTLKESESNDRRDEVDEVRKMSSKDTYRLRRWRIVVTSVLLLTALVVTLTTYFLLDMQEYENFKTAVCHSFLAYTLKLNHLTYRRNLTFIISLHSLPALLEILQ